VSPVDEHSATRNDEKYTTNDNVISQYWPTDMPLVPLRLSTPQARLSTDFVRKLKHLAPPRNAVITRLISTLTTIVACQLRYVENMFSGCYHFYNYIMFSYVSDANIIISITVVLIIVVIHVVACFRV